MSDARERFRELAREITADARAWCQEERFWPARAALLLWGAWTLYRHVADPYYSSIIGGLNFGIHELGHFVFKAFGLTVGIAGGSLFQCLVPVIGFVIFFRQRDYFAVAFSFGWLSTNLFYVGTYCADARSMQLPLLSPGGGDAYHDWNYLLDHFHLLKWDKTFAFFFRLSAGASMVVFLAAGGWLVGQMIQAQRRSAP